MPNSFVRQTSLNLTLVPYSPNWKNTAPVHKGSFVQLIRHTDVYPSNLMLVGSTRLIWFIDEAMIWRSSGSKLQIVNEAYERMQLYLWESVTDAVSSSNNLERAGYSTASEYWKPMPRLQWRLPLRYLSRVVTEPRLSNPCCTPAS